MDRSGEAGQRQPGCKPVDPADHACAQGHLPLSVYQSREGPLVE
jgi:hypothetical protein